MRPLKEVIADIEARKLEGTLSPVDCSSFLVELVPHHNVLLKTLDEALHLQAIELVALISAGKSQPVAKALVDAMEVSRTVRAAKTDVIFVEEYLANLKYLARAYEKEWVYSK